MDKSQKYVQLSFKIQSKEKPKEPEPPVQNEKDEKKEDYLKLLDEKFGRGFALEKFKKI